MFYDYNLITPQDLDDIILSPYRQALGEETVERISTQLATYDYYKGMQHTNELGVLVKASELPQPPNLPYKPTRYTTNYFKAIVDRKARWQMGGTHGIHVPRKSDGEQPDTRAEGYEKLLYTLWKENKMRARLIQAARDRLIADRVVCKIVFNPTTGKLHWVWVPDYEFIPIFSDDDFRDFIGAVFIKPRKFTYRGNEEDAIQVQRFTLEGNTCYFEDAIHLESDLRLVKTITPKGSLGIDFIPVQMFAVNELIDETLGDSEISDIRVLNDIANRLNEDATDSLKFEMFPMLAITNAAPNTAEKVVKAPGAVLEIAGDGTDAKPDAKMVESGFRWKEAFKDQYMRVKAAMHEISGLPQIVPQELNFGGINGDTLQILFHDIITDTEEHWLAWGYGLSELHEKSARYLQAMISEPNFAYDRNVVRAIGDDYNNEIKFVLPLPDNRKELVELLTLEVSAGFESTAGAMRRLGVENTSGKDEEIADEVQTRRVATDPYSGEDL